MASSHCRDGQHKIVLSCPSRRCELGLAVTSSNRLCLYAPGTTGSVKQEAQGEEGDDGSR